MQDIKAEETAPFKFLEKEEHNKRPIVYAKQKRYQSTRAGTKNVCILKCAAAACFQPFENVGFYHGISMYQEEAD